MIDSIEFEKIRSESKIALENLEIWIRNVIDRELTNKYGSQYWDYQNEQGIRIISNGIIKDAKERFKNQTSRYPRFVDALLLEDIIKIVCKADLFAEFFKPYFQKAYPNGNDEFRTFLNRLKDIRNKLSHANQISNHEGLQVMCYSNDIIDSIKQCYKDKNMEKTYNAPTIIKLTDSFGNQFSESQIKRNSTGRGLCEMRNNDFKVHVGQTIIIEIEIDPSFEPETYTINWVFDKKDDSDFIESKSRLELKIENKHVRTDFAIYCLVKSQKEWHRCGDVDDAISIMYEIAPTE